MPMHPSPPAPVTVSIVSHGQLELVRPLIEQLDRLSRGTLARLLLTINIPEPDALAGILGGRNFGKLLIRVAHEAG